MASQYYTPLSNGLQSFADASPEYEFADAGIGSFQQQASRLAEFGRNGDIYVVHAAEGETVIPTEVLEANPKVRELLFEQMRGMGLDPQEYVVGSELNSLNPVTGMPEFFFKSIFKSVKKAVKKVVKVAKKIAPVVLPLAAAAFGIPFLPQTFFGPGMFGSAFLGSGIGSLIGGASVKDSIKAGLVAGATTAVGSGLKTAFTAKGGSFLGNLAEGTKGAVYNPGAGGWNPFVGAESAADRAADLLLKNSPDPTVPSLSELPKPDWPAITEGNVGGGNVAFPQADLYNIGSFDDGTLPNAPYLRAGVPEIKAPLGPGPGTRVLPSPTGIVPEDLTALQKAQQFAGPLAEHEYKLPSGNVLRGTEAADAAAAAGRAKLSASLAPSLRNSPEGRLAIIAAGKKAAGEALPSFAQRWAFPGAVAATGLALSGALEPAEIEELADLDDERKRRNPLLEENPEDFVTADLSTSRFGTRSARDLIVPSKYPFQPFAANQGGLAQFPRRDMLVEGPGTERSDDIPAMLSDGEFVLNARSVRGADPTGRGNRYRGAQNLYSMMRDFEMKA